MSKTGWTFEKVLNKCTESVLRKHASFDRFHAFNTLVSGGRFDLVLDQDSTSSSTTCPVSSLVISATVRRDIRFGDNVSGVRWKKKVTDVPFRPSALCHFASDPNPGLSGNGSAPKFDRRSARGLYLASAGADFYVSRK
ncbi:hypothetical protein EVAR_10713_1 [Eumeta japonica]|uniref:Uncharacterized protein n=1 Tax=Eumeta variegata TaxID=151549 RepID=A0A4C1U725_EUMVA|nr:hypothetical protein EVAR_10713_1 [Eumeta japonica]